MASFDINDVTFEAGLSHEDNPGPVDSCGAVGEIRKEDASFLVKQCTRANGHDDDFGHAAHDDPMSEVCTLVWTDDQMRANSELVSQ